MMGRYSIIHVMSADGYHPGDEVIVAPGVYRECVSPKNGGTEEHRIVYRSEVPLGAVYLRTNRFDRDYYGDKRGTKIVPGPFAAKENLKKAV